MNGLQKLKADEYADLEKEAFGLLLLLYVQIIVKSLPACHPHGRFSTHFIPRFFLGSVVKVDDDATHGIFSFAPPENPEINASLS